MRSAALLSLRTPQAVGLISAPQSFGTTCLKCPEMNTDVPPFLFPCSSLLKKKIFLIRIKCIECCFKCELMNVRSPLIHT